MTQDYIICWALIGACFGMIIGALLIPKIPPERSPDTKYVYEENGRVLYMSMGFKGDKHFVDISLKDYPYLNRVELKEEK